MSEIPMPKFTDELFREHRTVRELLLLGLTIIIFLGWIKKSGLDQDLIIFDAGALLDTALGILLLSSLLLCLELMWGLCKILYFKYRYPLKSLSKSYDLIIFNGVLFLYDKQKKEKKWVASWQTAMDLGFVGHWRKGGRR